jgi:hypothetical protein
MLLHCESATDIMGNVEEAKNLQGLQERPFDVRGIARFPQKLRLFVKL